MFEITILIMVVEPMFIGTTAFAGILVLSSFNLLTSCTETTRTTATSIRATVIASTIALAAIFGVAGTIV